jgi:hypothetical protein
LLPTRAEEAQGYCGTDNRKAGLVVGYLTAQQIRQAKPQFGAYDELVPMHWVLIDLSVELSVLSVLFVQRRTFHAVQ